MGIFLSTYENKVDKKGRLSIPMPFRAAATTTSYQGVVLYQPQGLQCIEGADVKFLEQLTVQLYDSENPLSNAQNARISKLLQSSIQLAFDGGGRISLPQKLKDYAGISTDVMLVGLGRKFQIWDPSAFATYQTWLDKLASEPGAEIPGLGVQGLTPPTNDKNSNHDGGGSS